MEIKLRNGNLTTDITDKTVHEVLSSWAVNSFNILFYEMSFLQYFTQSAETPITANNMPIAIIFISRLTFLTISAPSA